MAKVKYYAKENSTIGTHSFYAVPIPNGTLTFDDLLTLNQQREDRVPDHIDKMFQERYGFHFNRD